MRLFYFIFLFCCYASCWGQNFEKMSAVTPIFVDEIDLSSLKENQLYISMPFAKKVVINPEQKKQLSEKAIIKLDLVYTKYRSSSLFNQKTLNKKRLQELNLLVPSLFKNPLWTFQLISQTKANSRDAGNKMFHGFIVTFRPQSTKKTLSLEASYLSAIVNNMLKKDSIKNTLNRKNYTLKTRYDLNIGYVHDTLWSFDSIIPPKPPSFFYNQSLYKDSTVLNSLERNKQWKNAIVVTDVTGSMSPYTLQIFIWLKQQTNNAFVKSFVFFNDGDERSSKNKKALKTKGIYLTKKITLDSVLSAATICMQNGSGGGEGLENDIEAIIEGLKNYPQANEIVLIADNKESMRDYAFIKSIKVPVHIILCGANKRINIQYLDLARQTNGSVHTKNSDITNLQDIKEKKHFFIEGIEYLYLKDRFHHVY